MFGLFVAILMDSKPEMPGEVGREVGEMAPQLQQGQVTGLCFQHDVEISHPGQAAQKGDELEGIDEVAVAVQARGMGLSFAISHHLRGRGAEMYLWGLLRRPGGEANGQGFLSRDVRWIVEMVVEHIENQAHASALVNPQDISHAKPPIIVLEDDALLHPLGQ